MDTQAAEIVAREMSKVVGEMSLAITTIVLALKRQPNFDIEAFDSIIAKVIEHPDCQHKEFARSLLNSVLEEPKDL